MSYGLGMLKGMAVTAKNFVESYYKKDRMVTVQYPEEKELPKENFRNIPFLLFDDKPDTGIRCVACKICEMECPPQCIYIEIEKDEKGKPLRRPRVFDIDLTVCMNCGICAETCPFEAIKMDSVYELSSYDRFYGQLADKNRLLKSNEYYHKIKPTEADAVDAKLKSKAKKPAAKAAAAPAKPAVAAPPKPTPAPAVAATPAKIVLPANAPFSDDQKAWLEKFLATNITVTVGAPGAAPAPTATVDVTETAPAAAPAAPEAAPAGDAGEPWHDQTLGMDERMKFVANRPLEDKLMAAMAQLDCQACGYNCRDYSMAIFKGEDPDISKCVPGETETKSMLKKLLQEAGKPFQE